MVLPAEDLLCGKNAYHVPTDDSPKHWGEETSVVTKEEKKEKDLDNSRKVLRGDLRERVQQGFRGV
jgi:hypothetical protein